MKVLIVGASGMVGQGVLRECLLASDVSEVLLLGRTPIANTHPRLRQLVHSDLFDVGAFEAALTGIDACFYCLGVSSAGLREATYSQLSYTLTLAIAGALARHNPALTFCYVSGAGTDSSERGRSMWARVKGRTENALQALPFAAVYLFRPGIIQPLHGSQSKTPSYRRFYQWTRPLLPLLKRCFPRAILTTEEVGLAMLNAARRGSGRFVLESRDIAALAANSQQSGR